MKKYQIILADPPWDSRKSEWGGFRHYPTMKTFDICLNERYTSSAEKPNKLTKK